RCRVVFDGQSLNAAPINHTYPRTMMANTFPGVPWNNVAIGGTSWSVLKKSQAGRTDVLAAQARYAILILCGGTSCILKTTQSGGDQDPDGATVMAHYTAVADQARAAGFDYIVATTITNDSAFDAGQLSILSSANSLILANGGAH